MGEAERRRMMNQGMPMMVPNVGKQPFDVREANMKPCAKCQGEFYDKVLRMGLISPMAPSNTTRQEVRVEFQVYLCRSCGHEFGKPVDVIQ